MLQGARDFVLSAYQELKKANPKFPILVRESSQAEAKLYARYDFGVEEAVSVEGLDKAGISSKLEQLVKKGESMPRHVSHYLKDNLVPCHHCPNAVVPKFCALIVVQVCSW